MITIKRNDYKEITEIREDVVQGICDAFLSRTYSTFHPRSNGTYRPFTKYIVRHQNSNEYHGFWGGAPISPDVDVYTRFYRCELNYAVKLLLEHGYYLHQVYRFNTWEGYEISKYPTIENGRLVASIDIPSDFDR